MNSSNFLIMSLGFMKTEPRSYTCQDVVTGQWINCEKEYICKNRLSRD